MNTISLFHVNTFTEKLFSGNPAAVCFLNEWLTEAVLQNIATENNLPVTAFLVKKNNDFSIRWFTPEYELDLCGHGTLASAFVLFNEVGPRLNSITFHSLKAGKLTVRQVGDLVELTFPAKEIEAIEPPALLMEGLGVLPAEVYHHKDERILAVLDNEETVKTLNPTMGVLKSLPYAGIVVAAPSKLVDFVSRTFYPNKNLCEDAVTGASHCLLIPYWAKKLFKNKLYARQVSSRSGDLICEYQEDNKVRIAGKAVLYMKGEIYKYREF